MFPIIISLVYFFYCSVSFYKFSFSPISMIDFSLIDCGFLLLCRSAGRSLLFSLSRFSPWAARANPGVRRINSPIFYVFILLAPVFSLKHICIRLYRGYRRRQGRTARTKKRLSALDVFEHRPGAVPSFAALWSRWAYLQMGFPVNITPLPPSAFSSPPVWSPAPQHCTVHISSLLVAEATQVCSVCPRSFSFCSV